MKNTENANFSCTTLYDDYCYAEIYFNDANLSTYDFKFKPTNDGCYIFKQIKNDGTIQITDCSHRRRVLMEVEAGTGAEAEAEANEEVDIERNNQWEEGVRSNSLRGAIV